MARIYDFKPRPYRYSVSVGDIVRMPRGVEGKVVFIDVIPHGRKYRKIVFVEPETNWLFRWIMWFAGRLWYRDKEIDNLYLLQKAGKKRGEK